MGMALEAQRAYAEQGFVVLDNPFKTTTLDSIEDALVDMTERPDDYEDFLDHEPDQPHVIRRVRHAHRAHRAFDDFARSAEMVDILKPILGDAIRMHGSKVNMKAAGSTTAVEWHQDWAFYPHSNDDVLAVGVMLDDVGDENGPLLLVPQTHRTELLDHHNGPGGTFSGAVDPSAMDTFEGKAVAATGTRGSVSLHHARALHGSAANRSTKPRRLFLIEYAAADAWPLNGVKDYQDYRDRLICGEEPRAVRLRDVPVRMPYPKQSANTSLFSVQSEQARRYFA